MAQGLLGKGFSVDVSVHKEDAGRGRHGASRQGTSIENHLDHGNRRPPPQTEKTSIGSCHYQVQALDVLQPGLDSGALALPPGSAHSLLSPPLLKFTLMEEQPQTSHPPGFSFMPLF